MTSINEVTLCGHIGRVDVKQTGGGTTVHTISLATQRSRKNQQTGEWESEAEWHRITIWGIHERLAPAIQKGAKILVKGRLQTRSWDDQNGQKRYMTEVVVSNSGLMLCSAATKPGERSYAGQGTADAPQNHTAATPPDRSRFPGADADADADIPF